MNQDIFGREPKEESGWVIQIERDPVIQKKNYKILNKITKDFALNQLGRNPNREDFIRVSQEQQITIKNLKRWYAYGTARKQGCGRKKINLAAEYKLAEYILQFVKEQGRKITRAEIRNKAIELFESPNFQASKGYLDRFIKQHRLKEKVIKTLQSMNKLSRYQQTTYCVESNDDVKIDQEQMKCQTLSLNITPNVSPNFSRSQSQSKRANKNAEVLQSMSQQQSKKKQGQSNVVSSKEQQENMKRDANMSEEQFKKMKSGDVKFKNMNLDPGSVVEKIENMDLEPSIDYQRMQNMNLGLSLDQEKFEDQDQSKVGECEVKLENPNSDPNPNLGQVESEKVEEEEEELVQDKVKIEESEQKQGIQIKEIQILNNDLVYILGHD